MLWKITEGQKDFMSDRNLWNPRSKANALIMYLCSMEPSFYLEVNKAIRTNDKSNIEYLGPLARALSFIHEGTKEKEQDKIMNGEQIGNFGPISFFVGCFLAFRGA